jgi:hypothetical protein
LKVNKTIYGLLNDLNDQLFLLDLAISNHNNHPALFKLMSAQLRTLVTRGKGGHEDLLLLIGRALKLKLTVVSKTPPDIGRTRSLSSYLQRKDIMLDGIRYSNIEFIKLLANESGEGLHVRNHLDPRIILGKKLKIGGMEANNQQLLAIAKTVSSSAHSLQEFISKIPKERMEVLNKNYVESLED